MPEPCLSPGISNIRTGLQICFPDQGKNQGASRSDHLHRTDISFEPILAGRVCGPLGCAQPRILGIVAKYQALVFLSSKYLVQFFALWQ
jgi:hypothetical protein